MELDALAVTCYIAGVLNYQDIYVSNASKWPSGVGHNYCRRRFRIIHPRIG